MRPNPENYSLLANKRHNTLDKWEYITYHRSNTTYYSKQKMYHPNVIYTTRDEGGIAQGTFSI